MRSSARSSVSSVSPIGSGSSTRSMAPRSSSRVIRTGESTLHWTFEGPPRSRSSPLPRCDVVGGRPEVAVPSSRHGHARTAGRGASRSVRHRSSLMPCSMPWTTSPELVSHRVRLAHRRAPSRSSSSCVARSMPSWPSAATSGITRHGFSSSRKPAAVSPIAPEDASDRGGGLYSNAACTVSCSLRFTTHASLTAPGTAGGLRNPGRVFPVPATLCPMGDLVPPDPPLAGAHAALRPFRVSDAAAIAEACRDPDIPRFTMMPEAMTEDQARQWVERGLEWWPRGLARFAVTMPPSEECAGQIGIQFDFASTSS